MKNGIKLFEQNIIRSIYDEEMVFFCYRKK